MQFKVMAALAETEVPVPRMLWEERTGDVIGDAFYVMTKLEGLARLTPAQNGGLQKEAHGAFS